jgi:hypothetical protein
MIIHTTLSPPGGSFVAQSTIIQIQKAKKSRPKMQIPP